MLPSLFPAFSPPSGVRTVLSLSASSLVTLAASGVAAGLTRGGGSGRLETWLQRVAGVMFVGLGVKLALSSR